MALDGHYNVDIESLKRWTNALSMDKISQFDIGGKVIELGEFEYDMLKLQLQAFSNQVNMLKQGDDWTVCLHMASEMFLNTFLRIDKSSIRIGDFYECLLTPSNSKTYKKIIKGFEYTEVGAIHIRNDQGELIAEIGTKSDLIWSTFYKYFIYEDCYGSIDSVYLDHEKYLSIQLFRVEGMSVEELSAMVTEILLRVSMEYDMDFKIFEVDSAFNKIGECSEHNMQFVSTGFEQIPMLYLSNAINSNDERLSYLSYYQVMEYFFVRCQNYFLLDELSRINVNNNVNHNELRKVLSKYKGKCNERSSLELVLTKAIDISEFRSWLSSHIEYQEIYCNTDALKLDISKPDKELISQLGKQVYSYRCSIAHAKGDVEEFIAIPLLSKNMIAKELPLLKYLAFKVIEKCSEREEN